MPKRCNSKKEKRKIKENNEAPTLIKVLEEIKKQNHAVIFSTTIYKYE